MIWIMIILTILAFVCLCFSMDTNGAAGAAGIVILILVWGFWPCSRQYPTATPKKEVVIKHLQKTPEYVSFMLTDVEGYYGENVIVKTEAKFVNKEFKVYQVFYEDWYGTEGFNIEYVFNE